jgi:hypothetical protein
MAPRASSKLDSKNIKRISSETALPLVVDSVSSFGEAWVRRSSVPVPRVAAVVRKDTAAAAVADTAMAAAMAVEADTTAVAEVVVAMATAAEEAAVAAGRVGAGPIKAQARDLVPVRVKAQAVLAAK